MKTMARSRNGKLREGEGTRSIFPEQMPSDHRDLMFCVVRLSKGRWGVTAERQLKPKRELEQNIDKGGQGGSW